MNLLYFKRESIKDIFNGITFVGKTENGLLIEISNVMKESGYTVLDNEEAILKYYFGDRADKYSIAQLEEWFEAEEIYDVIDERGFDKVRIQIVRYCIDSKVDDDVYTIWVSPIR